MKVKIKRIDNSMPLPEYHSSGAVAFDLYARVETEVPAKGIARIPTNVIIQIPKGYMLYVKDRSSTAKRKGLLPTAGIIDQDFHGPEDEILFQVYNPTDSLVVVEQGERIAQAIFVRIDTVEWDEVDEEIKTESRGAFGSTGTTI